MKKIIYVLVAASYASQIVGCATSSFCDPQSPSTLISTGNPVNIAAGAAQFTLCGTYNVTKTVVERSKSADAQSVENVNPAESEMPKQVESVPTQASAQAETATAPSKPALSPAYMEAIRAQAGLAVRPY